MEAWLQGGPFLEVRFVLPFNSHREIFHYVLGNLKSFFPQITIALNDKELSEKAEHFIHGYLDDDLNECSIRYNNTNIPLYVDLDRKRKAVLNLDQLSETLVQINIYFFAAESDAPEWDQCGINEKQYFYFKNLLHSLFDTFQFSLGTVGFEVCTTGLFDTMDGWPSKGYNLENLDIKAFSESHYFILIIAHKDLEKKLPLERAKFLGNKIVYEFQ